MMASMTMIRIFSVSLLSVISSTHAAFSEETQQVILSPVQPAWTKVCGSEKNVCYTVRDFRLNRGKAPIVSMAVYDDQNRHVYVMRLMLPIGIRTDLGFDFSVDGGPHQRANVKACLPTGCLAEAKFDDYITSLKQGHSMQVVATSAMNRGVTFNLPLAGFGPAFDGPWLPYDDAKRRQNDEAKRKRNAAPQRPWSVPADKTLTPI